jgi:4-aminobutyrate aminotransferase
MAGYLSDVWFRITDLEVVSGSGCWVTAKDGTRYLDFTSGIAVTNTGHCHPKVVKAIQEQAARFIHAQVNIYRHDLMEPLGKRLAEITPASIESFFFTNSGAEAIESSVKLAKQATGKPHIVVVEGSFHGRTHMAMAMTTSKTSYRAGYAPLPAGVFVMPFPMDFVDEHGAVDRAIHGLEWLLKTQTAPSETAAVVVEPILGEGGYLPAPKGYLEGIEEICRKNKILLVLDEIQSGFGRTGKMFACQHYNIEPDIIAMAKGIASGFPFASVGARAEIMARWPSGSHGGTYGGNAIGCAAALATIDVLTEEGFLDNVQRRGDQLRSGLLKMAGRDGGIASIRGLGLMVGADFVDRDGAPDANRCAAVIDHCRKEGKLLLMTAGPVGNTVRFMPPLVVKEDEMTTALEAMEKALAATA